MRRARAATLLLLALPGSTYIYQGEELGLPEVWDLPPEVLDDPAWNNSGHTQKGRDGCRVPIPWTSDGPSFGFGDAAPWLPQPARYGELSAAAQAGVAGSTLEMYRRALRLRAEHLKGDEDLEWLDSAKDVLSFRRGSGVVCIVNFGNQAGEAARRQAPDRIATRRLHRAAERHDRLVGARGRLTPLVSAGGAARRLALLRLEQADVPAGVARRSRPRTRGC